MKKVYYLPILFLSLGIILFMLGMIKNEDLKSVKAKVLDNPIEHQGLFGGSTTVNIQYEVHNKEYKISYTLNEYQKKHTKKGDTITVYYNKFDPEEMEDWYHYEWVYIPCLVAGIFAVLYNKKNNKKIFKGISSFYNLFSILLLCIPLTIYYMQNFNITDLEELVFEAIRKFPVILLYIIIVDTVKNIVFNKICKNKYHKNYKHILHFIQKRYLDGAIMFSAFVALLVGLHNIVVFFTEYSMVETFFIRSFGFCLCCTNVLYMCGRELFYFTIYKR